MSASGLFVRVWRILRRPLALLVVVFVGLIGWRMIVLDDKEATAQEVAAIHANRLEWSDIEVYDFIPPKNMIRVQSRTEKGSLTHYIPAME